MDDIQNKFLIEAFKNYGYTDCTPVIKREMIGWTFFCIVEVNNVQIVLSQTWIEKYIKHFEYWGYDKEVELANLILRAYCVIIGEPQDKTDLPVGFGVARIMVLENLLVGIKFRIKENTLFGEEWGKINELTGAAPQLIYAFNKK
jgi:hypothetical protein